MKMATVVLVALKHCKSMAVWHTSHKMSMQMLQIPNTRSMCQQFVGHCQVLFLWFGEITTVTGNEWHQQEKDVDQTVHQRCNGHLNACSVEQHCTFPKCHSVRNSCWPFMLVKQMFGPLLLFKDRFKQSKCESLQWRKFVCLCKNFMHSFATNNCQKGMQFFCAKRCFHNFMPTIETFWPQKCTEFFEVTWKSDSEQQSKKHQKWVQRDEGERRRDKQSDTRKAWRDEVASESAEFFLVASFMCWHCSSQRPHCLFPHERWALLVWWSLVRINDRMCGIYSFLLVH